MNTLSIRSRGDLSQATRLNKWFDRPDVASVNIESSRLDRRTRLALEQRIARLFNECGCGISACVFVAATLVSFFALRNPSITWLGQVGIAVLQALVLAIATKTIVFAITHVRLNNTLRQLEQFI